MKAKIADALNLKVASMNHLSRHVPGGRKPSYCPHCEGGLKADFASGHLGESIKRDSGLGFLPKNVS